MANYPSNFINSTPPGVHVVDNITPYTTTIIQRYDFVLSSNNITVGTTPVQISGGHAILFGSTAPDGTRQVLRITNTSATQNLYIGSTSNITPATGGGWFKTVAPQEYFEELCSGLTPRYVVADAANASVTIEEYK